jgi:TolA-binding protein
MITSVRRALLPGLFVVLFAPVQAQRPAHYEHRDADLARARELFDKAKYAAARYELERVVQRISDPHDATRTEAEFLAALCAVRLFNNDAGHRLLAFIDAHPEDLHVGAVRFELFKHAFARKRWAESLTWAEQVDRFALDPAELEEFRFKRGYAYFQAGKHEQALGEFSEVKDGTGIYAAPATYYASHIHYEKGQYETALQGFRKLEGDESFGKVVPHYIAQIIFLQGKYDELDAYVKPLLEDPQGTKRMESINRLAGEANYRTGNYTAALPYLEKSVQRTGVDRGDRYILGYTYYRTGDHKKALNEFNIVANGDDSLAQLAAYHMADSYLKLDQKTHARNAFKRAHELNKDPRITEDALFNYAKLSYELSIDPYHEAITALRNYLKAYPNTPRRDEAYEFLLNVYLRTKNYEAALEALDEIRTKDLRLQEAYQRLAYDRGVELYDGRKYNEAVAAFERALKFPVDQQVNARCHFWMAESYYAAGDLPAALRKYDDLRNSPGAYATDLYEQAGYGMGYTFFKMKDYNEAATAFRRFVASGKGEAKYRADAMLRTGDCYFVTKNNEQAVKWYDDAMRSGAGDRDYAQYQKGLCLGLLGRNNEKIGTLKALLNERPNSPYAADAKYQLADTYINTDNDPEAAKYYTMVVEQHPNSPFVRDAMLQGALILKRSGRTDEALERFKAIVAKYTTVEGSQEALAAIKAIHMERGTMAEYEAYMRGLSFIDPSTLDLDTEYYRSAEALYMGGDCAKAINALTDYLNKYPRGAYSTTAYFYRGDCLYRTGDFARSLPDLEEVIRRNEGAYLENAYSGASELAYKEGRYQAALDYYEGLGRHASTPQNTLAAQVGRMRSLIALKRPTEAATAAEEVAANPTANNDLKAEAGLIAAKGALDKGDHNAAYSKFKAVTALSTNMIGAEAKYHMAYVRHLQEKWTDAEKEVFDLVKKYPSYDHWKAKAFILLGDVYVQMGDLFQAKATLQSVVNNSDEADLVTEAQQRLDAIAASESRKNQPAPGTTDDPEIVLPDNTNGR